MPKRRSTFATPLTSYRWGTGPRLTMTEKQLAKRPAPPLWGRASKWPGTWPDSWNVTIFCLSGLSAISPAILRPFSVSGPFPTCSWSGSQICVKKNIQMFRAQELLISVIACLETIEFKVKATLVIRLSLFNHQIDLIIRVDNMEWIASKDINIVTYQRQHEKNIVIVQFINLKFVLKKTDQEISQEQPRWCDTSQHQERWSEPIHQHWHIHWHHQRNLDHHISKPFFLFSFWECW